MIYVLKLQIWRYRYFGHFNFIIYFVDILSLYIINLDIVSLFIDSHFNIFNDVE